MAQERRYLVFLSSTLMDLAKQRELIAKAIVRTGHFPVGMEDFPASGDQSWDVIRKLIDDCDYYVLLVCNRYGNIVPGEEISYTEKEYEYAYAAGKVIIPIFAKGKKTPDEPAPFSARQILFRQKLQSRHSPQHAKNDVELISHFLSSFTSYMSTRPQNGWIRGGNEVSDEFYSDYLELYRENQETKARIERLESTLAGDRDIDSYLHAPIALGGYAIQYNPSGPDQYIPITEPFALVDVFRALAPALAKPVLRQAAEDTLSIFVRDRLSAKGEHSNNIRLQDDVVSSVLYAFEALGLVVSNNAESVGGGLDNFWQITHLGKRLMLRIEMGALHLAMGEAGDGEMEIAGQQS